MLDTSVCIAAFRDHSGARDRLAQFADGECATSTIVLYELLTGVAKSPAAQREKGKVEQLLSTLCVEVFDQSAAHAAAQVRAELERIGRTCGPYDLLIAGHALALDLPLATNNAQEFSRIRGLRVKDWLA